MSQIELRKSNVTLELLDRLAGALNVPVVALLAEPEPGVAEPKPLPNGRKLGGGRS